MKHGLSHRIGLSLSRNYTYISPILGLSPLELELLLDQSLEQVETFHEENPEWRDETAPEERGNYFQHKQFSDDCKSTSGKIPLEKYLENPQIFVERNEGGYSIRYDLQIDARIAEKLAQFKRIGEEGTVSADKIFSKQFAKERAWIVEQQLVIIKYACKMQDQYLLTGNPLDLKPLTQLNVAQNIGLSKTSVNKLIQNLTIQLPDGKVIFANELIPGLKAAAKVTYALRLLQQERFGIQVATETVSKYKGMLSQS